MCCEIDPSVYTTMKECRLNEIGFYTKLLLLTSDIKLYGIGVGKVMMIHNVTTSKVSTDTNLFGAPRIYMENMLMY